MSRKLSLEEYLERDYVPKPVVFNMNNPYHRKVFTWLYNETTNFSGFIFDTVAMRYEGFNSINKPVTVANDHKDLMKSMI